MAKFNTKINITVVTDPVVDRYGKEEKSTQFLQLLDIEISATTLEKLQEKIHAHVDLVEGPES